MSVATAILRGVELSIAFANLKPGTGKTTGAVWLAHAMSAAGYPVLLVDADPASSALEWSDLAGGFPFRLIGLPVRDLHVRVPEIARPGDIVVIDAPQLEDHGGIARSALRLAEEVLIPVAPTTIELNRTAPVLRELADIEALRERPPRSAILLNRTVARALSTMDARDILTGLGYTVLTTTVPRLEVYAQSFGGPVQLWPGDVWHFVAQELLYRARMIKRPEVARP
jgi:chromosome partitioning protein